MGAEEVNIIKRKLVLVIASFLLLAMIPTVLAEIGDPMDGGPGGCCPTLYVYSNGEWVYETLFNFTTDVDTVLEHTLVSAPDNINGIYKMQLVEVNDTSVIDYVSLTDGGKLPLTSAVLNGVNVKQQLLNSDDIAVRVDYMQTISLEFNVLPEADDFTFTVEGFCTH